MIRRSFLQNALMTMFYSAFSAGRSFAVPKKPADAFPDSPGLTSFVSQFIVARKFEDIPAEVIARGKKSILDALGVALSGSIAPTGPLIRRYISSIGTAEPQASVIGTAMRSAPRYAALANGISIHADDFDDTLLDESNGIGVHPSAAVLPAVLAIAESAHCSGQELMLAYHVGTEVECKIARAIVPRNTEDALHASGTCGSLGSAAACAKLRRLTPQQTSYALGIAASEASGLRENFGTMTKPFNAGRAAENGVVAADLAALNWTASERILESSLGFFRMESDTYHPEYIAGKLGNPWSMLAPGVSIKPFPSGALTHPAMAEIVRLIPRHNIRPENVVSVELATSHNLYHTLLHHRPQSGLQGKFSLEFCISILLLERRAGIGQFTDAVVQRSDVQQMMQRVHYHPDPELDTPSARLMTVIRIQLKSGEVIFARNGSAKGSPQDPMTFDEVASKFRVCAEYAKWPASKTDAIITSVAKLEDLPDAGNIARLLAK